MINSIVRMFLPDYDHNWFMSYDTAFLTVTLTWMPYAAITTLLVLTEIISIDRSIIEAATVDGASSFQLNTRIILPLLKNIIGTSVILEASNMLKKAGYHHADYTGRAGGYHHEPAYVRLPDRHDGE